MQLGFKYICVKKVCLEKLFEMESRSQSRAIYLKKKKKGKKEESTNISFFLSCFPLRAQLFGFWKGMYLKLFILAWTESCSVVWTIYKTYFHLLLLLRPMWKQMKSTSVINILQTVKMKTAVTEIIASMLSHSSYEKLKKMSVLYYCNSFFFLNFSLPKNMIVCYASKENQIQTILINMT